MRVFPLFDSMVTDGPTDGRTDRRTDRRTDGRTDKASYRVACPQLKTRQSRLSLSINACDSQNSFSALLLLYHFSFSIFLLVIGRYFLLQISYIHTFYFISSMRNLEIKSSYKIENGQEGCHKYNRNSMVIFYNISSFEIERQKPK